MSVVMLNKYILNSGMKETGTSYEGLLPSIPRMHGQVPGCHNQIATNKTPLNADNV